MEDAIEFLENQLDRVNHWLEFAEAKNAAILVFNMTLFAAVLKNSQNLYVYHYTLLFFISTGCGITIISFFPCLTTFDKKVYSYITTNRPNLLFYGDIIKLTAEEYAQRVIREYFPSLNLIQAGRMRYEDLVNEILINSSIAFRKYKLFQVVVVIDLLVVLLVVGRIVYLGYLAMGKI